MREPIISLENIIVKYRIPIEQIGTFKEYAIRFVQGKVKHTQFPALNNVSLHLERGQIFGIVGQNGAGKSTLLKVIAHVLVPTSGRVVVRGWIAPLLDMGAGFHPELTGRENIFLNGAILGFNHEQIKKLLPEIINFAELGDFIDAPLRTYSAGMYARLAFSVATAARPDILLVDEILGVGDEGFQAKCHQRIYQFRDEGTTVVFVSHNMETVKKVCRQAAWLDHGELKMIGSSESVANAYHDFMTREEK
jgi:ABC-2 type transport system ATP-binding protein/lipopolysaccharide transport system ATP-binding protein